LFWFACAKKPKPNHNHNQPPNCKQTDGYDYHLAADYGAAWQSLVTAFRALADACPTLRVSVEHKPTDAAARYSFLPSTAAALLLVNEVCVMGSWRWRC
jgi:hypothetical protein